MVACGKQGANYLKKLQQIHSVGAEDFHEELQHGWAESGHHQWLRIQQAQMLTCFSLGCHAITWLQMKPRNAMVTEEKTVQDMLIIAYIKLQKGVSFNIMHSGR